MNSTENIQVAYRNELSQTALEYDDHVLISVLVS